MLRRPAWQRTLLVTILGGVLFVGAGSSASADSSSAFEGRFVVRHGDTFATGMPQFESFVELDDGTKLQLDFGNGPKPSVAPGQRVRVDGERHGNSVAVAAGGLQKQGGSVAAATTG